MRGHYSRQQIENWVGDFCSSDAILAFPSGVREYAPAILVKFMIAICEVRDTEPGDIEDAHVVMVLYSFRPTPPTLNLQRDFGVSDEQIEELAASLPPDLDPLDFSPAAFAEMDLETLLELMPLLLEIFGQGFGFSSEQIQQAMDMGLLDPSKLPTGPESFDPTQFQSGQQPRRKRPDEGDTLEGTGGARPRPRGGERKDPAGGGSGRDGDRPRPRGGGKPR
ncbi:MAG: hypothetical protein IIA33_03625 [Planctomycetes bacterium]|nr:hypothetical protein [Planctomycetota bacterium]